MKILALDGGVHSSSVALHVDGELLTTQLDASSDTTAQSLHVLVDTALKKHALRLSDLTGIAFGCGPGSFTGTRIVASIVQGMAYGACLPVLPVSSLRALGSWALRSMCPPETQSTAIAIPCLDARMGEVSVGVYILDHHGDTRTCQGGEARLVAPQQLDNILCDCEVESSGPRIAIGDGWQIIKNAACMPAVDMLEPKVPPLATEVAYLASLQTADAWLPAEQAQPVYLRGEDTWKTVEQQTRSSPL